MYQFKIYLDSILNKSKKYGIFRKLYLRYIISKTRRSAIKEIDRTEYDVSFIIDMAKFISSIKGDYGITIDPDVVQECNFIHTSNDDAAIFTIKEIKLDGVKKYKITLIARYGITSNIQVDLLFTHTEMMVGYKITKELQNNYTRSYKTIAKETDGRNTSYESILYSRIYDVLHNVFTILVEEVFEGLKEKYL